MKLSQINLMNFSRNFKTQETKANKAQTLNQTSISLNSSQEAIGRSQVSFKGVTSIINDDGTMTVSGAKSFQYNPATGELSYEERPGYDGIKLRSTSFNPKTTTKRVVEEYKDRITTTTTTADPKATYTKTIETIDNQKRQTYYYERDSLGTETTIITDYDGRKRQVKTIKAPDEEQGKVTVIELNTHVEVKEGEKVIDRITTDTGSELRNIINGDVYERVVVGKNSLTVTTFNQVKPSIKEKEVVKNGNGNKTTSFYPDGTKKQVVEINRNGNIKKTINYEPNGTESDKEIVVLYPDGQVKTRTKFIPNTEKIDTVEENNTKTGATTIHYFDSETQLKKSSTTTKNDGTVIIIKYQQDGETPETIKETKADNGSYSIEYFPSIKSGKFDQSKAKYINLTNGKASIEVSKDGKTKIKNCSLDKETPETIYIDSASGIPYAQQESERRKEYYTADDLLRRIEYIDAATGKVYLEEYADKENGGYIQEYKDSVTGITTEKVYLTYIRGAWQREIFYEGSNQIESRIIYQENGYSETVFDKKGNVIEENFEEY